MEYSVHVTLRMIFETVVSDRIKLDYEGENLEDEISNY